MLGGLINARRRVVVFALVTVFLVCLLVWLAGFISLSNAVLFIAGALSGVAALWREFSRSLLLAHHQGGAVVKGDGLYAALLFGCSVAATFLPSASLLAVCSIGVAAGISAALLSDALWKYMRWNKTAKATPLGEISTIGGWAAFGAGVHWSFSQGYTYIVAALMDVNAVAAIAATRLLLMPVQLLSTGVNQALYPLVARWHATEGLTFAALKVMKISVILVLGSLAYAGVAWLLQDWYFLTLMRHDVLMRSTLLLYWSLLVIVMLFRDQVSCLLVVRMKVKSLGYITSFSAISALIAIFALVPVIGTPGALLGVIVGELINIAGMLVIFVREIRGERRTQSESS
jgi:O-antigen/teichoic acid export membrane protein